MSKQSHDGGIVNTGVMGNVQAGHGTQINIGGIRAGRNVHIGGVVFHGPTEIAGPIIGGDVEFLGIDTMLDVYVLRGTCDYCRTPYEFRRQDGDPVVKCVSCSAPLPL
jgi:hypothetical protein